MKRFDGAVPSKSLNRYVHHYIAGVGGDVAPLVDTATAGRPTIVIDGCPLECARTCLEDQDVEPTHHVNLAKRGVPKEHHVDYDDELAEERYAELREATEQVALDA